MAYPNDEWQRKGATLSDKTARQELGLTQDEIYDAIDAGTLRRCPSSAAGSGSFSLTAWTSLPPAQETESHATPAELMQHADAQRPGRLAGS